MNFSNLKYFLVASEEMNITKAAQRLHISQQALSNHISKLEHELGTPLFERTPSLSLTYAGRRLVDASTHILDIQAQFLTEIDDINQNARGELTIGITHTRGQAILPLVLPKFMEAHPYIDVRLEEANAKELEENLQHGFVDLVIGFTPFSTENATITELSPDRLFLAVPTHYLNSMHGMNADIIREEYKKGVDISIFKDMPFILLKKGDRIRTILDEYFKKRRISPKILLETSNIQTAFALSLKGMGISVYPERYMRGSTTLSSHSMQNISDSIDLFPLQSSTTTETLAIAYNKERYLTTAAKNFIAMCQDILGSKE